VCASADPGNGKTHHGPGNIRELQNIIERAFILRREGDFGNKHLPEKLTGHTVSGQNDSSVRSVHDALDAQAIRSTLGRTGFNRLEAAKELGIHTTTLFRRVKRLGIQLPERDGRARKKQ
jgi:transcriptional regulator with PAS, ATPase and Fis domain